MFCFFNIINRAVSLKTAKKALEEYTVLYGDADEIIYTSDDQKLIMGKYMAYFPKAKMFVQYKDVKWIYKLEARTYGIPMMKVYCFSTRNGRGINVPVKSCPICHIERLSGYIKHLYDDVIVGYSTEHQKEYYTYLKQWKKEKKSQKNNP